MKNFKNVFFATLLFAGAAIATTCRGDDKASELCEYPVIHSKICNDINRKRFFCSPKTNGCETSGGNVCFGHTEPGHVYPVIGSEGVIAGRCRCE